MTDYAKMPTPSQRLPGHNPWSAGISAAEFSPRSPSERSGPSRQEHQCRLCPAKPPTLASRNMDGARAIAPTTCQSDLQQINAQVRARPRGGQAAQEFKHPPPFKAGNSSRFWNCLRRPRLQRLLAIGTRRAEGRAASRAARRLGLRSKAGAMHEKPGSQRHHQRPAIPQARALPAQKPQRQQTGGDPGHPASDRGTLPDLRPNPRLVL